MQGRLIVPDEIRRQAEDMSENFRNYKTVLQELISVMDQFVGNEGLDSDSYNSMKEHFEEHKVVLRGMICMLDAGVEDACALKQNAGDERLDEELIEEQIRKLTMRNLECQENIEGYQSTLQDEMYARFLGWWARWMITAYQEEIENNERMIRLLREKLERIEEIDAATSGLFAQDLSPYLLEGIGALGTAWNGTGFVPQTGAAWRSVLAERWTEHVQEGTRIGLKEEGFVRIVDEMGKVHYGGNQEWFSGEYEDLRKNGCGVIATINLTLYLSGRNELTKEEYMDIVRNFVEDRRLVQKELETGFGYDTISMMAYTNRVLNADGLQCLSHWKLTQNGMLEDIRQMLSEDMPVILEIGDGNVYGYAVNERNHVVAVKDSIPFYELKDGEYVFNQDCQDHYITVTGIIEHEQQAGKHRTMLEISTWGEKYYIDYDEYLAFIDRQKKDNGIVNAIKENALNNILYIEKGL